MMFHNLCSDVLTMIQNVEVKGFVVWGFVLPCLDLPTPRAPTPSPQQVYDFIRSYSPYENLRPGAPFPAMLLTAGLHDPRVPYWQVAQYVAKLRALTAQQPVGNCEQQAGQEGEPGATTTTTVLELQQQEQRAQEDPGGSLLARTTPPDPSPPLLLLTDMDSGHFAASGASSRLEDRARKLSFAMLVLEPVLSTGPAPGKALHELL